MDSEVLASLICDGVHVHPVDMRLTARIKGFDRIVLITDAATSTGLSDREYVLFRKRVHVKHDTKFLAFPMGLSQEAPSPWTAR
ncbi:MAG: hypothetical protein QXO76_07050 [Thermoproteota archaeon]